MRTLSGSNMCPQLKLLVDKKGFCKRAVCILLPSFKRMMLMWEIIRKVIQRPQERNIEEKAQKAKY